MLTTELVPRYAGLDLQWLRLQREVPCHLITLLLNKGGRTVSLRWLSLTGYGKAYRHRLVVTYEAHLLPIKLMSKQRPESPRYAVNSQTPIPASLVENSKIQVCQSLVTNCRNFCNKLLPQRGGDIKIC